jgi:hypothetical protein
VERILTSLALLMPAFSLPSPPRDRLRARFTALGTLFYRSVRPQAIRAHSFGDWLEPRYILRARTLDQ